MLTYFATISSFALVLSLNLNPTNTVPSCVTQNNEPGTCVPYYQCNDNGTLNTDGVGVIDIRFGGETCPSYLDTCCRPSQTRGSDDPITPKPSINHNGCGWRNPNGLGFKTKGTSGDMAMYGEFPWMIAVLKLTPIDGKADETYKLYMAGGSLIHPSVVLTAAHSVMVEHHYLVRAGEWDTQTEKELYPYQERDVADVLLHDKFNQRNLHYDIALMFLESAVNMAPNVGIVCLPPPNEKPLPGARCLASGWGKDLFGKQGKYQVILKKVEVPVVDSEVCQKNLRTTRLGLYFKLSKTFMCAGGGEEDTCKGDGGSPLVCPIQHEADRYVQSGIVSWGISCREYGIPGVYVNVAILRPWIDKNVASRGFDTKVYSL
ncbi:unnamed protein product [Leptosia nina]|uniref:Phenoloxidase-activating factor 2 n=1 Tax=Leptosia nina TaxID=320188 RepID=A0AAV1JWY5_9NEOP